MPRPKGYKHTEETKEKNRIATLKAHADGRIKGFAKGNKLNGFKGKTHSKEHKEWLSIQKTLNPMMANPEVRRKFSEQRKGANNPAWKGGRCNEKQLLRGTAAYKQWRKNVFERDLYTCQKCRAKSQPGVSVYLNAHHIKEFSKFPELALDLNNGITLCKPCHSKETGHEMLNNKKGKRK